MKIKNTKRIARGCRNFDHYRLRLLLNHGRIHEDHSPTRIRTRAPRMLGHAHASMTLDVYSHLFADDLDAVADRMHAAKIAAGADQVRTRAIVRLPRAINDEDQNAV